VGSRRRAPRVLQTRPPVKARIADDLRRCTAAEILENDNVVIYIEAHGDDLMSRPTRMKKMLSLIVLTLSAIKAQRAAA
jgi:hypothetical protein